MERGIMETEIAWFINARLEKNKGQNGARESKQLQL